MLAPVWVEKIVRGICSLHNANVMCIHVIIPGHDFAPDARRK